MIMATHDMSQGQQLADRIGVLIGGKFIQTGNADNIFRSPQSEEVANFVGMENICVRHEDVTLALSSTQSSARNSFQGKITRVNSVGPLSRLEIDYGFRLVALVTKISAEELNLQVSKEICATFKATGVHIMERKTS